MPLDDIHDEAELRMMESIEVLEGKLRAIRTGRPNPALVTSISIEAYGAEAPLQQLAAVSITDGNCLVIRPFDPSIIGEIEKGIIKANLGLNPANDGKLIRLVFPTLSEERRKQHVARAREEGEQARVALRNIRRDANKGIDQTKKDGAPEDERFKMKDKVQKLIDEYEKKITERLGKKTEEIMEA